MDNQARMQQVRQKIHGGMYLGIQELRQRPVGRYMLRLRGYEQLNQEAYQELVSHNLKQALQYALQNVPLYQSAAWREADPRQLSSWPILERQQLRDSFDELHARRWLWGSAYRNSSGSTGSSVRVGWDSRASAWNWALEYRAMEWHGVPIGTQSLHLWGFNNPLADLVLNRRYISTRRLDLTALQEAADFIQTNRPRLIWGTPSAIFQVARYIGNNFPPAERPRVPFAKVGGEQLYPFQRAEIYKNLGARLVNAYGASEAGAIAAECPLGSLHIFSAHVLVEILRDGEPVPHGEMGDIVTTSLTNRYMPLIRYRLGDRGMISPEPCACGLPYPVLARLQGRTQDLLVTATGRQVHSAELGRHLNFLPWHSHLHGIRQVLFQQMSPNRWEVLFEGDHNQAHRFRPYAAQVVQQVFGQDCAVEVLPVDAIPREPSGKFRYYRSLIDQQPRQEEALSAQPYSI
jgi:phenylacetate-CoA ligase